MYPPISKKPKSIANKDSVAHSIILPSCGFSSLPDDVLSYIAQSLSLNELWKLSQVSTVCRDVCYHTLASCFQLDMRYGEGGPDAVEFILPLRGALITLVDTFELEVIATIIQKICCGTPDVSVSLSRVVRNRVKAAVEYVFIFATLPVAIECHPLLVTLLATLQRHCSNHTLDGPSIHIPDILFRNAHRFLKDMGALLNPFPSSPDTRKPTIPARLRALKRVESCFSFFSHAQKTSVATTADSTTHLLPIPHFYTLMHAALAGALGNTSTPHVLPAKVRILEGLHASFQLHLTSPPLFHSAAARRTWVAAHLRSRQFYSLITTELARALAAQAFKMFELILKHQEFVRQSLWQFPQFRDWARVMLERLRKQVNNGIKTQAYGVPELQLVERYRSFWTTLVDEPTAVTSDRSVRGRWTEDQMRAEGKMLLEGVKGYV